jgi:hypothetical protein
MPAAERVTRSSFARPAQPISAPHSMPLLPRRVWSDDEWERIQHGHRSCDMDDRWNLFTEGAVAFLHRSWTGHGIFAATFAPAEGGGRRIVEAIVESDPEHFRRSDDEHDCLMLERVLDSVIRA